jgi:hypothetical protein
MQLINFSALIVVYAAILLSFPDASSGILSAEENASTVTHLRSGKLMQTASIWQTYCTTSLSSNQSLIVVAGAPVDDSVG